MLYTTLLYITRMYITLLRSARQNSNGEHLCFAAMPGRGWEDPDVRQHQPRAGLPPGNPVLAAFCCKSQRVRNCCPGGSEAQRQPAGPWNCCLCLCCADCHRWPGGLPGPLTCGNMLLFFVSFIFLCFPAFVWGFPFSSFFCVMQVRFLFCPSLVSFAFYWYHLFRLLVSCLACSFSPGLATQFCCRRSLA